MEKDEAIGVGADKNDRYDCEDYVRWPKFVLD
jgi:hypothetical protein